jgi:hypothetical protein
VLLQRGRKFPWSFIGYDRQQILNEDRATIDDESEHFGGWGATTVDLHPIAKT